MDRFGTLLLKLLKITKVSQNDPRFFCKYTEYDDIRVCKLCNDVIVCNVMRWVCKV